jgi:hypothetical protein
MNQYNINLAQATVAYSYEMAVLAFIDSKFKGIYIGGKGWKWIVIHINIQIQAINRTC